MIGNSSTWVVSDVDGTLMDHSYDLTPAKETIKTLQKLSIPVIPVSYTHLTLPTTPYV